MTIKVPRTRRPSAAPATVLISEAEDEHGDYLTKLLAERGGVICRLSYDSANSTTFTWEPGGRSVGFAELSDQRWAGMWRRTAATPTEGIQRKFARFAASEWRDALEGALASAQISWLSTVEAIRHGELKLVQLTTAQTLGIRYPRTLVTNDPVAAREFVMDGPSVIKPIRYGLVSEDPPLVSWTRDVAADELDVIDGPPVMLQERIVAAYHLRIVTVGDQAFASKLQAVELDWRSNLDNHDRFRASADPLDVRVGHLAVLLAQSLRLGFSSQDWLVDRVGDAWFLDLNPNGQWLFLEPAWQGAITNAIADQLEVLARC